MGINRARPHSRYIILAIVIIASMVVGDIALKLNVEKCKRQQARYNLEQIRTCLDVRFDDYDMDTDTPLAEIIKPCVANSRTSVTGDVYVLDYSNLEIVEENSKDVPNGTLYFTKDSIGDSFHDWDSAAKALYWLTSGRDSGPGQDISYNYDGSPEWLEWINYIPKEYMKNDGLIIVQGTQQDESLAGFKPIRSIVGFFAIIIAILLITFNVTSNRELKNHMMQ